MKKSSLALVALLTIGCGTENSNAPANGRETIVPNPGNPNGNEKNLVEVFFTDQEKSSIEANYSKLSLNMGSFDFDATLSRAQNLQIKKDLLDISKKKYDTPKVEYFAAAFGGANATSVLGYLNARIKAFLGQNVSAVIERSPGNIDKNAYLTAQNFGTLLWYNHFLTGGKVTVNGSKRVYEITSMRAGLINILKGYVAVQSQEKNKESKARRLASSATLIHEARHSDCSEALTTQDADRIRKTNDLLQGNAKCGHLHVACPSTYGSLAGVNACDADFWGAYSLSGLYNQMIEQLCLNCSASEKEEARIGRIDSLARVLPFQQVQEGEAIPLPDMNHQEQ